VEIRSFADLITPDERALRFTPLGLSTAGTLKPEAAAEFQQLTIASADLIDAVPDSVRQSFERLRTCHSYGVLWYDAFTVAADLSYLVLEQALRERFVDFYGSSVPVETASGQSATIVVRDFDELEACFRRGGAYARGGWKLRPTTPGPLVAVPRNLAALMGWARREGLLYGQRNKRVEPLLADMRNRFAHGTGFRIGMPNDSAREIHDLAEIINRLWGAPTPGGRLYPAPLVREAIAVGWLGEGPGTSLTRLRPDQIPAHMDTDRRQWTYLLLLAVPDDEELWEFDARYELTTFPCDLLWGPGPGADACSWWQSAQVEGDTVEFLDRLFAVRVDAGKVYLPQRAEVLLSLPPAWRRGVWHLIRADFPLDAWGHVRHLPVGTCRSADEPFRACPVEDVVRGSWTKIRDAVLTSVADISPSKYFDVHVPRRLTFPTEVGYE
jgi:hypothetical protein